MPKVKVTGVTISEIWDDESRSEISLDSGVCEDTGAYVSIGDNGQTIYIKKTTWPEIREQIDGLFESQE